MRPTPFEIAQLAVQIQSILGKLLNDSALAGLDVEKALTFTKADRCVSEAFHVWDEAAKQIASRYPTDERVSPATCQHNWLHETVGNKRIEVCHKCGSENLL